MTISYTQQTMRRIFFFFFYYILYVSIMIIIIVFIIFIIVSLGIFSQVQRALSFCTIPALHPVYILVMQYYVCLL